MLRDFIDIACSTSHLYKWLQHAALRSRLHRLLFFLHPELAVHKIFIPGHYHHHSLFTTHHCRQKPMILLSRLYLLVFLMSLCRRSELYLPVLPGLSLFWSALPSVIEIYSFICRRQSFFHVPMICAGLSVLGLSLVKMAFITMFTGHSAITGRFVRFIPCHLRTLYYCDDSFKSFSQFPDRSQYIQQWASGVWHSPQSPRWSFLRWIMYSNLPSAPVVHSMLSHFLFIFTKQTAAP